VFSSSFLVKHRSSTRACHLTLFCAVPFVSFHVLKMFTLQLCHSRRSPGVLGSPPLSLPLWVPLQCPLDYMSIWSPQRVARRYLFSRLPVVYLLCSSFQEQEKVGMRARLKLSLFMAKFSAVLENRNFTNLPVSETKEQIF